MNCAKDPPTDLPRRSGNPPSRAAVGKSRKRCLPASAWMQHSASPSVFPEGRSMTRRAAMS